MNKKIKILIIILLSIILLWGVIFLVDYFRCVNLKMPIFVISGEIAGDGGSGTYYGLGYSVEVEKNISAEYDVQIGSVEMYIFDKCIAGGINCFDNKLTNTSGITTALTLEDEITNDTIWCGTFQLIWNDLKNDLAKQDIIFTPQLKVVENLNKETFTTKDISEESYYKKIGTPSLELKKEIEKAIKDKFNEKSDILDDFEWENRNSKDYFLYAMLKKEFKFEKAFEKLSNGSFGEYENIEYFGIESSNKEKLRSQVNVLYYDSEDNFAIKLNTKQKDELILCKNPKGKTFNEIFKNITDKEKNYKGKKYLTESENLKVPNIKFKEKTEFTEIQDKPYEFSNGDIYSIEKAIQTIEFELDRTGGKIKSEAGMMNAYTTAIKVDIPRSFYIDDTFAIFLIEEDKQVPYFAGLINDITKFQ